MDKIEYTYPVEELDKMIEILQSGAKPMMTDRMKVEVELRYQEYLSMQGYEDDDTVTSLAEIQREMREKIESEKRKATRNQASFRQLPKRIQEQLAIEMSEAIVRKDPASVYNKTDEELFSDKEQKDIIMRLSKIRNAYYDPISYRSAIMAIHDAIDFSLRHDYPWLTYEEAVNEFNNGKIRYHFGNIPKLFLGYGTKQITDPQILAGIVSGEITILDRSEEKEKFKYQKKLPYNPIDYKYEMISDSEYQESVKLHNRGVDTPVGIILKSKAGLFDRLSLPFNFTVQPTAAELRRNETLLQFDWMKPNAGIEYFHHKFGIPYGGTDAILSAIYEANKDENGNQTLSQALVQNIPEFLRSASHPEYTQPYASVVTDGPLKPTDRAAEIEADILNRIRSMNTSL